MKHYITSLLFVLLLLSNITAQKKTATKQESKDDYQITFVELGSVNCIPCKKMQPIMSSIEKKYEGKVKVKFYDVWKADQKKYAEQYKIRLIPTQVFLDSKRNEIARHEGFFPEAEIEKIFAKHNVHPVVEK